MPSKTTPKDFFLWAGAMISLYVSVFAFISLLFEYISYAFPDALTYNSDPYSSLIRFDMAALIVLFPLFLFLMRIIRRDMAKTPEKRDLWVRRWALVLTLFVGGITVAIDLIVLITNFLGGDLTIPFLLKVLIVLLVVGGLFLHFLADMRGYWQMNRQKATYAGIGAGIVVLCAIVAGFFIMGAPWDIRLHRFDEQKVNDLSNIEWQVVSYWQQQGKLPTSLSDLTDSISGNSIPTDPQSGTQYEYIPKDPMSFQLCAIFNKTARQTNQTFAPTAPVPASYGSTSPPPKVDNWYHDAGRTCFDRSIDPNRYPHVKK